MEKRYQVFISSTFEDLSEERREVIQALLELDCIPAGMEMFPAASEEQWSLIKRVIEDCDYYVVIVGGRYGSLDSAGVGYTEREFDYAVGLGKPVLAFVHSDPQELPAKKTEKTDAGRQKWEAFRVKVLSNRLCKFWRTPGELGGVVSRAVVKTIRQNPGEGWIRGRHAADPAQSAEMARLLSRIRELEDVVAKASHDPPAEATDLQQGDDRFVILYNAHSDKGWSTEQVTKSWDEIFRIVGSRLYAPLSEAEMQKRLSEVIRQEIPIERQIKLYELNVLDMSFSTMKIQLAGLGLIELSDAQREPPCPPYWELTAYGRAHLASISALRRDKS